MSQTVQLAAGTRFLVGRELIELAEPADFIFPNARNLDEVAETLATSTAESVAQAANLRLNTAVLERQIIATSAQEGGFAAGTALDVSYGPRGEKIHTTRGIPPALNLAATTVQAGSATILRATFDRPVVSPGGNYALGFSVKVNGVARAINAAARQADHKIVHFTLASAVLNGEPVLLTYNASTGDLKGEADVDNPGGAKVQSVTDAVVTNNV